MPKRSGNRFGAAARAVVLAAHLGAAAAAGLGATGCAGHEDRVRTALEALDRGAPESAVAALDEELDVSRPEDLPSLAGDNALLLLDRGTTLMSLDNHRLAARDLGAADKAIDMLDLSRGAAADVGKYLFSDDVGPYKAPAYEKLLVNTVNVMNYLAVRDLTGAKVEARRLAVMQKYLREHEGEGAMLGLGSYLAGFAFEKAGDASEALRYYDEALRYAQYPSLREPLRRLVAGRTTTPGIDALVAGAEPLPPLEAAGEGEILVVVAFGRVPRKEPVRIPIGLALTLVSGAISPHDSAKANALAAKGLVTWINYPTLGKSRGSYAIPSFALDGRPQPMEQALDVEAEVRAAWKKVEGTVILAAITRMITRVVAGEVAQGATEAVAKDAGPLGLLVGLATSATLTAVDTPDTRCWSTLPARVAIARVRVAPGRHVVRLGARGTTKEYTVDVPRGGWAMVPMMVLR